MNGKWRNKILEVKRINQRLIRLKVMLKTSVLKVISGFTPQIGCSEEQKESHRNELEEQIREMPDQENVIFEADLNGRVGKWSDGYEDEHGGNGYGE